jgi:hypothetical protein
MLIVIFVMVASPVRFSFAEWKDLVAAQESSLAVLAETVAFT